MKIILVVMVLGVMISFQAQAWISKDAPHKSYTFKYKMPQETFELSMKAANYEEAFSKAAQACFDHFKAGQKLTEERGLDIIDVCANPRS